MSLLQEWFKKIFVSRNGTGQSVTLSTPTSEHPALRFKLGDGYYFEFEQVSNGMGGYRMVNVYLLKLDDPTFKRCIVDEKGKIENFPGVEKGEWVKELEFPLNNKTQFRFWIYAYTDGKASVEWTLQPDGRYFEDEDGFGAENCEEITLYSSLDTNVFLLSYLSVDKAKHTWQAMHGDSLFAFSYDLSNRIFRKMQNLRALANL